MRLRANASRKTNNYSRNIALLSTSWLATGIQTSTACIALYRYYCYCIEFNLLIVMTIEMNDVSQSINLTNESSH